MHEVALMRALVVRVLELAQGQQAVHVERVVVRMGALGHGRPSHLQWHFSQAAAATLADGAVLDVVMTDELVDLVLESIDLELPPSPVHEVRAQQR